MSLSRLIQLPLLVSALALAVPGAGHAATILTEGFDNDTASLAAKGWVLADLSSAGGNGGWFEPGAGAVLPAYSGSSYMAANYLSAGAGGTVDDWLISPVFSTADSGYVTLYLAGDIADGYVDTLKFGFSTGSADTSAFSMVSSVTATAGWTAYTFAYAAAGAGSVARFAIEYAGDADVLNYVGVDAFSVTTTPVPEPATWALFALGAAALTARRRAAR